MPPLVLFMIFMYRTGLRLVDKKCPNQDGGKLGPCSHGSNHWPLPIFDYLLWFLCGKNMNKINTKSVLTNMPLLMFINYLLYNKNLVGINVHLWATTEILVLNKLTFQSKYFFGKCPWKRLIRLLEIKIIFSHFQNKSILISLSKRV